MAKKQQRPRGGAPRAGRRGKRPELDADLQAHLGHHLKAMFEDTVNEPVPERFARLLERLEDSERSDQEEGE